MNKYINFEELLTVDELDQFFYSDPLKRADLMVSKLNQHLLVNQEILYRYDSINVLYKPVSIVLHSYIDYLSTVCRKLVLTSFEALSIKDKKLFRSLDQNVIFHLNYFRDFMIDVFYLLTDDTETFDVVSDHIVHYRNGYFNIKTKKFLRRDPCVDYITRYINEDYVIVKPKKVITKVVITQEEEDDDDDDIIKPKPRVVANEEEEEEEEEEEVKPKPIPMSKKMMEFSISDIDNAYSDFKKLVKK
jgi:hypothetical protein